MTELDAIRLSTDGPVTLASLLEDLERIGIVPGMTLIVHSSLSSMGWVCGGPVTVIRALETGLGPKGTLIMPTHSADLSDPKGWECPPVDSTWWGTIRETMPPFDPNLTPTRGMGAIPECFRKQPGVTRSRHPQMSFAAWGADAEYLANTHPLNNSLGEESPLARVYELDGSILLIGVGHDANTSLHLAEYRADFRGKTVQTCGAPIAENGVRKWATFDDVDLNSDDFSEIGKAFEEGGGELTRRRVGYAESLLMRQRSIVDFAVEWMEKHRT